MESLRKNQYAIKLEMKNSRIQMKNVGGGDKIQMSEKQLKNVQHS